MTVRARGPWPVHALALAAVLVPGPAGVIKVFTLGALLYTGHVPSWNAPSPRRQ